MVARLLASSTFRRWWKWVTMAIWAILLIGLPLTSFPVFTRLTGATVAPFSAIPLAALLLVWFVPYLLQHGRLPKETIPFLIFTLFVIGLAAFAFFQWDEIFRQRSLLSQTIRTFVPFGLGLFFYLTSAAWHKSTSMLTWSLRLIYIGGILVLVWSIAQLVYIYFFNWQFPPIMDALKNALATQFNMNHIPRLAGLAFEPSWFAHQLNMLYLPLWLAASYLRTSVFPKLWKISVENVCLVVGLGMFFMSSPRISAAALMLMLLYLFIKFNLAVYKWVIHRMAFLVRRAHLIKVAIGLLVMALMIGIYAGFSYATFKVASDHDWRLRLLVTAPLTEQDLQQLGGLNENTLFFVGQRFAFLERTVFWMDGWHIFNDYPLTGVGLGNAGYYFQSHMPSIGWLTNELRTALLMSPGLPNIKSLWYRLLAETGIIGFSLFVTWLILGWASTRLSMHSSNTTIKTIALAGQLVILASIFEGFSVDTFGLPYLYMMMGLVASAGFILRHPPEQIKA